MLVASNDAKYMREAGRAIQISDDSNDDTSLAAKFIYRYGFTTHSSAFYIARKLRLAKIADIDEKFFGLALQKIKILQDKERNIKAAAYKEKWNEDRKK